MRLRVILSRSAVAIILYLMLSIPESKRQNIISPSAIVQSTMIEDWWPQFERDLQMLKHIPKDTLHSIVVLKLAEAQAEMASIDPFALDPEDPGLAQVQNNMQDLSPMVATVPELLGEYKTLVVEWKTIIKEQSRFWDLQVPENKARLYSFLHGTSLAYAQASMESATAQSVLLYHQQKKSIGEFSLDGINLKSGDLVIWNKANSKPIYGVSKDLAGSYDGISIVHTNDHKQMEVIFLDHLKGIQKQPLTDFSDRLATNLMVLRLRDDHPAVIKNPNLPHLAASYAAELSEQHVSYDYSLDKEETEALYATELISMIYQQYDIELGLNISGVNSENNQKWLQQLGVKHYDYIEPFEFEFDPNLEYVGEVLSAEHFMEENVELAITYAALENFEEETLSDNIMNLPKARLMKFYSSSLNLFGIEGPIPKGMSAETSVAYQKFEDNFGKIYSSMNSKIDSFETHNQFRPTYPRLLQIALVTADVH